MKCNIQLIISNHVGLFFSVEFRNISILVLRWNCRL